MSYTIAENSRLVARGTTVTIAGQSVSVAQTAAVLRDDTLYAEHQLAVNEGLHSANGDYLVQYWGDSTLTVDGPTVQLLQVFRALASSPERLARHIGRTRQSNMPVRHQVEHLGQRH